MKAFACVLIGFVPCTFAQEPASPSPKVTGHVFAWPFLDVAEMTPRGGMTKGTEVTLRETSKEAWKSLQEAGTDKQEQDRRAIRAMAGCYRVSFDFIESLGLQPNFQPARPYFSWATEVVAVLEDRPDFISLQHTLVMFFKNEQGQEEGPYVMKHWRQDWTWQDPEIFQFEGNGRWQRLPAPQPQGRWSQAVFQVDDSPRYEVMGEWSHVGGMSVWRSDLCPRPLPRRESTVRKDYNVLEGYHELTITPTGWVHVQTNRKLQIDADGARRYLGQELGVNRYEEITSPDLVSPSQKYWEKTAAYWQDVRDTWKEVFQQRQQFRIKEADDGEKLFSLHFGYAAELEKGENHDPEANRKHARETIARFLETDS